MLGSRRRPPDAERERFARVVAPHQERLFQVAYFLSGDLDEAADLAQEALVRAFAGLASFRDGSPPRPWLLRILRNVYLDARKSARARHEVNESALDAEMDQWPGDADLAAALEREEVRARVHRHLGTLGADHALVLTLADIEGLSYEEVAVVLEVPLGTVRSRLSRARNALRAVLAADPELCGVTPRREAGSGTRCRQGERG